jgi:hypothetical protein
MIALQFTSVESPLLESGVAASLALRLVGRAQTMGFLPTSEGPIELDHVLLGEIAALLRRHGVAVAATASLAQALRRRPGDEAELVEALRATVAAVDASPHPDGEWGPARELLGDELLSRLLRVSSSSLRRYAGGERRTPDEVAWRLHVVARVLAALIGSYNDYGVRRWFARPRTALGGGTPCELLEQSLDEDDERLALVVALAEELTGAAAAA